MSGQFFKRTGWRLLAGLVLGLGLVLAGAWLWMRAPSHRAVAFSSALNEGRFDDAAAMVDPAQQFPGDWANPAKWIQFEEVNCESYVAPCFFPPHLRSIRDRQRTVIANVTIEHQGDFAAHHHVFLVSATSTTRKSWPPTDALGSRVSLEEKQETEQELEEMPADIADIPALDLREGGDNNKRYFLIGLDEESPAPENGYKLLVVMPGGDASAGFTYFVRRVYKNALGNDWLIAQLVAPAWDARQKRKLVWPRAAQPYPGAEFQTEEFFDAVLSDVRSRTTIDPAMIHLFAWSSGGPAGYSIALNENSLVSGAFIAMSVFNAGELQPLNRANGQTYFLLQSPDDQITKYFHAERAEAALKAAGARVRLRSYPGGHGWRGDFWDLIREGIRWLESGAEEP